MIYFFWLILLALLVISYIIPEVPIWLPLVLYFIVLIFRVKEKLGNHYDWKEKINRDEKIKIEEFQSDLEQRGMLSSGLRIKGESKIKQDFQYKRRRQKRAFENELINCLFLK